MSYCRMGANGSGVYMYGASETVECSMCSLSGDEASLWGIASFRLRSEAIAHLRAHREAGDHVPDYAVRRLELEVEFDSDDARTNPWESKSFAEAWERWCNENDPWEEREKDSETLIDHPLNKAASN